MIDSKYLTRLEVENSLEQYYSAIYNNIKNYLINDNYCDIFERNTFKRLKNYFIENAFGEDSIETENLAVIISKSVYLQNLYSNNLIGFDEYKNTFNSLFNYNIDSYYSLLEEKTPLIPEGIFGNLITDEANITRNYITKVDKLANGDYTKQEILDFQNDILSNNYKLSGKTVIAIPKDYPDEPIEFILPDEDEEIITNDKFRKIYKQKLEELQIKTSDVNLENFVIKNKSDEPPGISENALYVDSEGNLFAYNWNTNQYENYSGGYILKIDGVKITDDENDPVILSLQQNTEELVNNYKFLINTNLNFGSYITALAAVEGIEDTGFAVRTRDNYRIQYNLENELKRTTKLSPIDAKDVEFSLIPEVGTDANKITVLVYENGYKKQLTYSREHSQVADTLQYRDDAYFINDNKFLNDTPLTVKYETDSKDYKNIDINCSGRTVNQIVNGTQTSHTIFENHSIQSYQLLNKHQINVNGRTITIPNPNYVNFNNYHIRDHILYASINDINFNFENELIQDLELGYIPYMDVYPVKLTALKANLVAVDYNNGFRKTFLLSDLDSKGPLFVDYRPTLTYENGIITVDNFSVSVNPENDNYKFIYYNTDNLLYYGNRTSSGNTNIRLKILHSDYEVDEQHRYELLDPTLQAIIDRYQLRYDFCPEINMMDDNDNLTHLEFKELILLDDNEEAAGKISFPRYTISQFVDVSDSDSDDSFKFRKTLVSPVLPLNIWRWNDEIGLKFTEDIYTIYRDIVNKDFIESFYKNPTYTIYNNELIKTLTINDDVETTCYDFNQFLNYVDKIKVKINDDGALNFSVNDINYGSFSGLINNRYEFNVFTSDEFLYNYYGNLNLSKRVDNTYLLADGLNPETVCQYLTKDNRVISFFENSGNGLTILYDIYEEDVTFNRKSIVNVDETKVLPCKATDILQLDGLAINIVNEKLSKFDNLLKWVKDDVNYNNYYNYDWHINEQLTPDNISLFKDLPILEDRLEGIKVSSTQELFSFTDASLRRKYIIKIASNRYQAESENDAGKFRILVDYGNGLTEYVYIDDFKSMDEYFVSSSSFLPMKNKFTISIELINNQPFEYIDIWGLGFFESNDVVFDRGFYISL